MSKELHPMLSEKLQEIHIKYEKVTEFAQLLPLWKSGRAMKEKM